MYVSMCVCVYVCMCVCVYVCTCVCVYVCMCVWGDSDIQPGKNCHVLQCVAHV